jgi:hypothetical protein
LNVAILSPTSQLLNAGLTYTLSRAATLSRCDLGAKTTRHQQFGGPGSCGDLKPNDQDIRDLGWIPSFLWRPAIRIREDIDLDEVIRHLTMTFVGVRDGIFALEIDSAGLSCSLRAGLKNSKQPRNRSSSHWLGLFQSIRRVLAGYRTGLMIGTSSTAFAAWGH